MSSLRHDDAFALTGAASPPARCRLHHRHITHHRRYRVQYRQSAGRRWLLCSNAIQSSLDEAPLGSRDESRPTENDAKLSTEWQRAVQAGTVSLEVQQRYAALRANPLLAPFLRWRGIEERLLADPGFLVKVGIEVGIGLCTKTTAEATQRGSMFASELDFVAANIVMALLADFCLVWLPAPTVSYMGGNEKGPAAALERSPLRQFASSCPDNCFQKVQPDSEGFTLGQRAGALLVNGMKLLAVGTAASLTGVSAINGLVALRQHLDPSWTPLNPPQDIWRTSLAYGTYMATSSNLRYQIIAGICEERGIEVWFEGNPRICGILSFLLRTSNTFAGSMLWVVFVRMLGMQAHPH